MARLSKEVILAALDLPLETVSVPEWGGEVLVRGMTAFERDEFEKSLMKEGDAEEGKPAKPVYDPSNMRARLCALCMVDENGTLLFSAADAAALGKKSGAALDRVFQVARRLSGLGEKDLEQAVKN